MPALLLLLFFFCMVCEGVSNDKRKTESECHELTRPAKAAKESIKRTKSSRKENAVGSELSPELSPELFPVSGIKKQNIKKQKSTVVKQTRKADNSLKQPPSKKSKSEKNNGNPGSDPIEKINKKIGWQLDKEKRDAVEELLKVLNEKGITAKDTFYNLFGYIEDGIFIRFCSNAVVFFQFLSEKYKNTGTLTSMLGNKKKHIKDFANRNIDELKCLAKEDALSSFSSMNCGKGVPKEADVKRVKSWEVWKVGGHFNMELFRTFSSMNSCRGLLTEEDVKRMKGWDVWKVNGKFSMELFRAFSSMNSGRGLPNGEDVKRVKGWEVWKVNGHFNMGLFRAFSSMNSSKGLPKEEEVKRVMGWDVRKTLARSITSARTVGQAAIGSWLKVLISNDLQPIQIF